MNTYLNRFQELASLLAEHPKIELLNFEAFPGLSDEALADLEARIGKSLNSTARSFFQEMNGLQLLWVHLDNEDYDSETFPKFEGPLNQPAYRDAYRYADGCINIPSLGDILIENNWEDIVWRNAQANNNVKFSGNTWNELELMQAIFPFDLYSDSACAAFFAHKDAMVGDQVLIAKDHYCEIDGSSITDFASYLEFLLATMGAVPYRSRVFAAPQGHRLPSLQMPASFWSTSNSYDMESPPEW